MPAKEYIWGLGRRKTSVARVRIAPGDLLFGDSEGVLVTPQAAIEEAFSLAVEKARGEKLVRKAIQEGMSACEAFATFGIM